jgi:pimeloyl-ACP methyl ester carboxylesterase
MAEQRSTIEFTVDGLSIAALTAGPAGTPAGRATGRGRPLIAALHGGTYTARYFDVAGSPQGTFMDLAAAAGYPVVSFDRPGYGASPALAPAENTFDRHARLLAGAIAQAAAGSRPTGCSWPGTRSAA